MTFSEKLGLLMDITKTTNNALALHVSLDASYISRLRNGKRLAPRDDCIVKSMGEYFAINCTEDYQKRALGDIMGLSSFPDDIDILSCSIAKWLLCNKNCRKEKVGQFLGDLSSMEAGFFVEAEFDTDFPRKEIAIYYGVEGKRQAALHLINEVLALEKPITVLVFSDEETSWMTGDLAFARKWVMLMMTLLSKGHHVKVIHTLSRDLDEMLNAISQWLPLYMAGSIEPYFYPKKRDGVFRNTLVIAPGTAAVVSGSVGTRTEKAANLLIRDPAAVRAYEDEFNQYLSLCHPLMQIYNAIDKDAFRQTLSEFEKKQSSAIIKTESLTLLTMPEDLFRQIVLRAGISNEELLTYHHERLEIFNRLIQDNSMTEIISLPDPQDLIRGKVKIMFANVMESSPICYTIDEYILHLSNIAKLLKTYDNYHVCIQSCTEEENYVVYAKEDYKLLLIKNSLPPIVLSISEGNITAAFWDYLKTTISEKTFEHPENKLNSEKLCRYIEDLKQLIN